MLIAALVIGLLTAYYFGIRIGVFAAAGAAVCFVAAAVIPGAWLYAYGIVAVGVVGILVVGPRMPGKTSRRVDLFGVARKSYRRASSLWRRVNRR